MYLQALQYLMECVLNANFSLPVSLLLVYHFLWGNLVQEGKPLITDKLAFLTLSEAFSLTEEKDY